MHLNCSLTGYRTHTYGSNQEILRFVSIFVSKTCFSAIMNKCFLTCSIGLITPEVSCPVPSALPNGFITFAVMRQHSYKEKVKYACNEHFVLEGDAEVQCQNTGNWSSQPVCRGECYSTLKAQRRKCEH